MASSFSFRPMALVLSMLCLLSLTAHAESDPRFIGLRHVPVSEVRNVLPEAVNKVTFLDFSSPMCLDCQKMKPVLKQFRTEHPNVFFKAVDVNIDQRTQAGLLRAFKPMTVPALVVINRRGEIVDVLYNYQPLKNLNFSLIRAEASVNKPLSKHKP